VRAILLATLLVAACGGDNDGDWVVQTVPEQAFVAPYTLWVFSETDVWLGGSSLWHWDGSAWREAAAPANTGIVDFWGFAPDDLWAIGSDIVFHWDGSAWSEVAANNGVVLDTLVVAWGTSSTDLWIANANNSRIYHWDGTTWTRTTLQFVQAQAMWGSSSSDIWLSGITDAYHWDGSTWTEYEADTEPRDAWGLWGFASDDVWAAGSFDSLMHWDGTTWTTEVDEFDTYNGIWGAATDDIYAVGDFGVVSHFDGTKWSTRQRQLGSGFGRNFTTVHGSSSTNVWATAVDLETFTTMVLRFEQ